MRVRHALLPLGFAAAAVFLAAPVSAAPLHSAPMGVSQSTPSGTVTVAKRKRHYQRRHVHRPYPRDNVGSIIRTPGAPYYAYNPWSRQYHYSCVIDLGYGRTQSCDSPGR